MSGPRALLLLVLSACSRLPPDPADTDEPRADTDSPTDDLAALSELRDEDLIVTEVMADPDACPDAQYVELLYRGRAPADLAGLVVSSSTQSRTLSERVPVRAGDRVLLARSLAGLSACYGVTAAAAYDLTLDPTVDTLTVGDGALRLFGELDLTALPGGRGVASERSDDEDSVWCAATDPIGSTSDRGSPAAANGPCGAADTDPPVDTDGGSGPSGVDTLAPGDLLLTEFMANPTAGDDTLLEFVEVLNTTVADVDLHGLVLEDASTVRATVAGHRVIGAGQRALLVRDLPGFVSTYGVPGDAQESLGLNNGGDLLRLSNGQGVLDEVDFRAWRVPEGASLQRDDDGCWCVSTAPIGATADLGTPGGPNGACDDDTDAPLDTDVAPDTDASTDTDASVAPLAVSDLGVGDLEVVEFMPDPSACTDPSGEYVELRVHTARPVNLAGLVLADAVTRKAFPASHVVQPGARVVLFQGASTNCYGLVGLAYTGLTLNNAGGDQFTVEDGTGRALASLDYRGWTLTAGHAWTKDFAGAWCLATTPISGVADLGSPGLANGPCPGTDTGGDDTDATDTDSGAPPVGMRLDTGGHTGETATAPGALARSYAQLFGGLP